MLNTKNQKGFSTVEALLLVIIVGIIGFVGWYIYQAQSTTTKAVSTTSTASQFSSTPRLTKKYADAAGNFSVKYPASWKLAITTNASDPNGQNSEATLTSPAGTVLNLNADFGGKGGDCQPSSGDKPFQAGNHCPSWEYLSSVPVPSINNDYYAAQQTDQSGNINFTYKKTGIVLTTAHFADTSGKSLYIIGLTESDPSEMVKVNKPATGAFIPEEFINVYDSTGEFSPYVYAYATSSSKSFLTSKDAASVKAILGSLQLVH